MRLLHHLVQESYVEMRPGDPYGVVQLQAHHSGDSGCKSSRPSKHRPTGHTYPAPKYLVPGKVASLSTEDLGSVVVSVVDPGLEVGTPHS